MCGPLQLKEEAAATAATTATAAAAAEVQLGEAAAAHTAEIAALMVDIAHSQQDMQVSIAF